VPVSFSRLRVVGFKSFAEPVVVEIRAGLTGIVGPNGCGKSNLVDALRWAMGEGSARALRGTEMDDVIFSGTAARPSRNLAEVTLLLEDAEGVAPPPWHTAPELEVTRRIERGVGSVFRINGREARARDVQNLFADLASGARASAIIGQGRITALVTARPEERRLILEEAAGITGLHARRHEAELKLRAAEGNLGRAEDLKGQLEAQHEALKRQARQATRYRNLSGHVRAAEAELLAIGRARAEAARAAAAAALHAARAALAEATVAATTATAVAATAAARLPELRAAEAGARTALERRRVALEQLAAEVGRAEAALREAEARAAQIARDQAHAAQSAADAEAAAQRLAAEAARLAAEADAEPAERAGAEAALLAAAEAASAAERAANAATEEAAALAARQQALSESLAGAEARVRRLAGEAERLRAEEARATEDAVGPDRLAAAAAAQAAAEMALREARSGLEAAEQARAAALAEAAARRSAARGSAEQARAAARMRLAAARERDLATAEARGRLAAEVDALAEVLAARPGAAGTSLADALEVPAGLEKPLAAALGEALEAPLARWRELPPLDPMPPLPPGAAALAEQVRAPAAVRRALGQIGLIEDGAAAQAALCPGQALVNAAGALWRWDGFSVPADAPAAAAVRLQQRNRLAELRRRLADVTAEADAARADRDEAEAAEARIRAESDAAEGDAAHAAEAMERDATAREAGAHRTAREAEARLERARSEAAALAATAASAAARRDAIERQSRAVAAELAEARTAEATARTALAALADPTAARAAMQQARAALTAARAREREAAGTRDALARAADARAERLGRLVPEQQEWRERAREAALRQADLAARAAEAAATLAALQAAPVEAATRRRAALDAAEEAEATHRAAADALAAAEGESVAAERAARAAEAALAQAREAVVRAEAEREAAEGAFAATMERIRERLGAEAALPDPPADLDPQSEERARRRLEKLQREREEMGPVNLRAELEAEAVARQIDALAAEGRELTTAIAKLRGSIGHLNREGRERLASVFEQVDRNFQALFARSFGGGRAHLALVGSDDPLEAGLEIFVQPPGKKLAALSLLSGGEQALTALSLIFAVFRCNPAPICVLDEVEAALDDANVDRFCALMDDLVRETATRFIVVTHHPLTMARMDRLYGVTMQERGVSRLLSVDLQQASAIAESAPLAAE
jgi:chromosome segregation protein